VTFPQGSTNQRWQGITVRNVRGDPAYWQIGLEGSGGEFKDVTIENCHFVTSTTNFYPVLVNSTVRQLRFRNIHLEGPSAGGPYNTGLMRLISAASTCVVDSVHVIGKVNALGRMENTVRFFISGLFAEDTNHQAWFETITGAAVTIRGCNGMHAAANDNITVTAGTTTSEDSGFRVDVNNVVRSANGRCWNTNAARSCGVGPVQCNGTTWTHEITGATF
jgi:hypothetical protein